MNNTFPETIAAHPLVTSIGWTLVHFVWQAALIGVVFGLAFGTMQRSSAHVRYLFGLVGLALMTVAPIGTFVYLVSASDRDDWSIRTHLDTVQPLAMETRVAVPQTNGEIDFSNGPIIIPGGPSSDLAEAQASDDEIEKPETRSAIAGWFSRLEIYSRTMQRWLPWCVVIWIAGVMCLAVRLLAGLRRVWLWRNEGTAIVGGELAAAVTRLSARMNLRQRVRLLETARDAVPAVIGWTRPAIFVPVSMLSGLTTSELESILAHELAHIRRFDYLVNLMQTVVETLLFYHPAVWWLSNRIRAERENCCDDIAIAVCGNRVVFAQALARMEEIRCRGEQLAMAADGGSLVGRIRRIVGTGRTGAGPWWPAGAIVLGSLCLSLGGLWMTANALEPGAKALTGIPVSPNSNSMFLETDDLVRGEIELHFQIVERDDERITRSEIGAFGHGRSATELVRHFAALDHDIAKFRAGVSTTNMETIVSAAACNHLEDEPIDAAEVMFNLPEGSGLRAEFIGQNITITKKPESTIVSVFMGRVELIDGGGVIRASASPDGSAEMLVVECREELGEVVMKLTSDRAVRLRNPENPPVQVLMNTETGAPKDEEDPPHRGIRYEIQRGENDGKPFIRMKMKWRYELNRLADEATAESGLTLEQLVFGEEDNSQSSSQPDVQLDLSSALIGNPQPIRIDPDEAKKAVDERTIIRLPTVSTPDPPIEPVHPQESEEHALNQVTIPGEIPLPPMNSGKLQTPDGAEAWGELAPDSGLRSRLSLQTDQPAVGQSLLLKLEVRNFGHKPTTIDPQRYAPFRVLRAKQANGQPAQFIGMTPQTSADQIELKPGESFTFWENVDGASLFLLNNGQYKFLAKGGQGAEQAFWRDSNILEFEIAAGEQTPLVRLVEELGKNLPDKWKVSNAMGQAEGWKGVFLTHLPTSLKRDATGIQIWFTDEKLAGDFELGKGDQKQIVTQLGDCELGFMNVAARRPTLDIWPKYLEHIRCAANAALHFRNEHEEENAPVEPADFDEKLPWTAKGTVTTVDGKPFAGVTVNAFAGMGSLMPTGSAVTDGNGRYELRFGPGIWSDNPEMVQMATIFVKRDGYFEKNLGRQGDLLAAYQIADPNKFEFAGRNAKDVFLPNQPKVIDFVMVPATRVRGMIINADGKRMKDVRVSLVGEELPPSTSVVANTQTNERGEFELNDVPVGFDYQLLIEPAKAESPGLARASPPLVFVPRDDEFTLFEYLDGGGTRFSSQQLTVTVHVVE